MNYGVPLLSAQAGFFRDTYPQLIVPDRFNIHMSMPVPAAISITKVKAAVAAVWEAHSALRTRFIRGQQWRQVVESPGQPVPFRRVDLSRLPKSRRSASLAGIVAELNASFRIERGSLIRFLLVDAPHDRQLVVVAHHLVCDLTSFGTIESHLSALFAGDSNLGMLDYSYEECTTAINDYAYSDEVLSGLEYWTTQVRRPMSRMPRTSTPGPSEVVPDVRTVEVSLRPEIAASIFTSERRAPLTGADATIRVLGVLGRAFTPLFDGEVFVQVVRNGRDMRRLGNDGERRLLLPPGGIRAVGWFVAEGALILPDFREHASSDSYEDEILARNRSVPNHGVPFSLLHHVSASSRIDAEIYSQGLGPQMWINHIHSPFDEAAQETDVVRPRTNHARADFDPGSDPLFRGPPLALQIHSTPSSITFWISYETDRYRPQVVNSLVRAVLSIGAH